MACKYGWAKAHAVNRRRIAVGNLVRSLVFSCGIYGGTSGPKTGFSLSISVFPRQYNFTEVPKVFFQPIIKAT
jgi:hypothetical protein